ncbi:MAG: hypothetical protein ACOCVL_00205 [Candidatus Sumerlaeota bacterium]
MPSRYRLKRFLERQKYRYRYLPMYVKYRSWSLFSREERRRFETLARSTENFQHTRLLAVGNEGLIYDGRYEPDPENRYLLKVSLNKNNRAAAFHAVLESVKDKGFDWLYRIVEYDVDEDGDYWRQVQEFVEGTLISRYILLSTSTQRELADPARLCRDLVEQNRLLHELRILAPNVDEENLILSPEGVLRRIDLDPYRVVPESAGEMPRYDNHRLFRVIRKILHPHIEYYRGCVESRPDGLAPEAFEDFLRRLANSAVCTYGDPRKRRQGKEVAFDKADCFTDLETPHEILSRLVETRCAE